MLTRLLKILVAAFCVSWAPSVAAAQEQPLASLLPDLIRKDILLDNTQHRAHFEPNQDQKLAPDFFNQQIILQLSTFPIGSPSGGLSYMFDSATGTFQRATQSFGPAFAERAFTLGRNKLSVGFNFQYSKYTKFEGADLESGDVKFYLRHEMTPEAPFYEGDVIEAALKLKLSSSTTTLFANYGVLNNWDFTVAVPIQSVSMEATTDATVLRLATGENDPTHEFENHTAEETFPTSGASSGSASGIGDVLLRTKYRFVSTPGGGLAVGLDLRLPTGDETNLLGTGVWQGAITFIGSSTRGAWSPHFNFGFTGTETNVAIPNELDYRFGTEFVAAPTVTLNADFIGRTLFNAGRLHFVDTTLKFHSATGEPGQQIVTELEARDQNLYLNTFAVGAKINVAGNLLINGNLLFNLTSAGVSASVTPVIGLDYSF